MKIGKSTEKKKGEKEKRTIAFHAVVGCDMLYKDVIFHFGDLEALRKILEKKYDREGAGTVISLIKEAGGLGVTVFRKDSGLLPLVYLPVLPATAYDYAVLAHEIHHAAHVLLDLSGVPQSDDTEEVGAYLVQRLTDLVLHEYWSKCPPKSELAKAE